MKKIVIEIINPIFFNILSGFNTLKPALNVQCEVWRRTQFRKIRTVRTFPIVREDEQTKKKIGFTGFIPRIKQYCRENRINLEIRTSEYHQDLIKNFHFSDESLSEVTLRPDQQKLVDAVIQNHRGVLIAPMRSGKTVVASAILNKLKGQRALFMVPKLSLLNQTRDEFIRMGLKNVEVVTGGEKTIHGDIVIANVQTLVKIDLGTLYWDYFSAIIADEVHLMSKDKSSIEKIMRGLAAPIRIGLTATMPSEHYDKLMIEGLFGPVIGELTQEEAKELKIMAEPKLKLIPIPEHPTLINEKSYKGTYQAGIVAYQERNEIIIDEAKKLIGEGKSVLIFVNRLEHGYNLMEVAKNKRCPLTFIQGATDNERRDNLKKALNNKMIKSILSTVIWREGVNIPTLDAVIMAAGMKSEIGTLQGAARSLTKIEGKEQGIIIDFIDIGRYLSEHFAQRMSIYVKRGWI